MRDPVGPAFLRGNSGNERKLIIAVHAGNLRCLGIIVEFEIEAGPDTDIEPIINRILIQDYGSRGSMARSRGVPVAIGGRRIIASVGERPGDMNKIDRLDIGPVDFFDLI